MQTLGAAAAAAPTLSLASAAPIGTTACTFTRRSVMVPAAGERTSTLTLSVSSVVTTSSTATESPTSDGECEKIENCE